MNDAEHIYEKLLRSSTWLLSLTALFLLLLLVFLLLWWREPDITFAGKAGWGALLALTLGGGVHALRFARDNIWYDFSSLERRNRSLGRYIAGVLSLFAVLIPYCLWVLPAFLHQVGNKRDCTVSAIVLAKDTCRLCPSSLTLELNLDGKRCEHRACNVDESLWQAVRPGSRVQVQGRQSAHGFVVTGLGPQAAR